MLSEVRFVGDAMPAGIGPGYRKVRDTLFNKTLILYNNPPQGTLATLLASLESRQLYHFTFRIESLGDDYLCVVVDTYNQYPTATERLELSEAFAGHMNRLYKIFNDGKGQQKKKVEDIQSKIQHLKNLLKSEVLTHEERLKYERKLKTLEN